ncbi:MAG: hypothetical protein QOE30_5019 [Mycobacterium sp.]|jgi:hypothetical protein|uniref:hypothetical protein n=1 Tax=Mycobacterium sp. TaxID=1785 RepID=UPI0028B838D4|nr:hypothetical protein [Mycobacterium sp.]MDT5119280.1 hypothetical protein [Mycobacterium sp.]
MIEATQPGPDTLSTSARLAKAERERDEALRRCADLEQVRGELAETRKFRDLFEDDNQRLKSENVDLIDRSLALKAEIEQLRNPYPQPGCGMHTGNASNRCLLVKGHGGDCDDDPPVGASALAEIGRLKAEAVTSADNYLLVAAELSSARQDLDVLRKSLKGSATTASAALQDLASARADVLRLANERDAAIASNEARLRSLPAAVLSLSTRYLCETCGARYGRDYGHEHGPLTRVTVTITRAPELFPTATTNQE